VARLDTLSLRERRVIIGGTAILAVALAFTYAVMPFVRHWREREAKIEGARTRVAYLGNLVGRTDAFEAEATRAERALSSQRRRVLHARSSTLAASALQTFLQEAADASHVVVTRLEVSPDDSSASDVATGAPAAGSKDRAPGGTRLPATLSAYGDISGAATLLNTLMTGPRVLLLDRLTLTRNAALAGAPDVVQLTMTLRAPVLPQ
jgi:hypothetical protein